MFLRLVYTKTRDDTLNEELLPQWIPFANYTNYTIPSESGIPAVLGDSTSNLEDDKQPLAKMLNKKTLKFYHRINVLKINS